MSLKLERLKIWLHGKSKNIDFNTPRMLVILCALNFTIYKLRPPGNKFWPGIDAISPIKTILKINDSNFAELDFFTISTDGKSGRAPFNNIVAAISHFSNLNIEATMSVLSSFCIIALNPLLIIAFYLSLKSEKSNFKLKEILALVGFVCIIQYSSKFPIHIAGYGVEYAPWISPQNLAEILCAIVFILIRTSRTKNTLYLLLPLQILAILVHPTSAILMTLILIAISFQGRNPKTLIFFLSTTFIGLLILRIFFYSPPSLNSLNMRDLYVTWRHPWHMSPTYILEHDAHSILIQVCILMLITSIAIKRKKYNQLRVLSFVTTIVLACFIFQIVFVEVLPITLVILFGPSRVFAFTPFLLLAFLIYLLCDSEIRNPEPVNSYKKKHTHNLLTACFSMLFVILISTNIYGEYKKFHDSTLQTKNSLNLESNQLVLIDPTIDTIGWREFMEVPIYFDGYFPFNPSVAAEYGRRWVEVCGRTALDSCDFSNKLISKGTLIRIMKDRKIDIIVVKFSNHSLDTFSEFRKIGESTALKSYVLVNPSS